MGHCKSNPFHAAAELPVGNNAARVVSAWSGILLLPGSELLEEGVWPNQYLSERTEDEEESTGTRRGSRGRGWMMQGVV